MKIVFYILFVLIFLGECRMKNTQEHKVLMGSVETKKFASKLPKPTLPKEKEGSDMYAPQVIKNCCDSKKNRVAEKNNEVIQDLKESKTNVHFLTQNSYKKGRNSSFQPFDRKFEIKVNKSSTSSWSSNSESKKESKNSFRFCKTSSNLQGEKQVNFATYSNNRQVYQGVNQYFRKFTNNLRKSARDSINHSISVDKETTIHPMPFNCLNNMFNIVLDSDIKTAPRLKLEDVKGNMLNNEKLEIDAAGLKNGKRNQRDGYVFFGCVPTFKGVIINDFVINVPLVDERNKRIFTIFYDLQTQKYFIKKIKEDIDPTVSPNNSRLGTSRNFQGFPPPGDPSAVQKKINLNLIYVKINTSFWFMTRKFFFAERNMIKIEPLLQEKKIKITVYRSQQGNKGSNYQKEVVFNQNDEISIGNCNESLVELKSKTDKLLNFLVKYDEVCFMWKIEQLDYKPNVSKFANFEKKELGSLWMLLDEKFELVETTYVKISKYIIKIAMIQ